MQLSILLFPIILNRFLTICGTEQNLNEKQIKNSVGDYVANATYFCLWAVLLAMCNRLTNRPR